MLLLHSSRVAGLGLSVPWLAPWLILVNCRPMKVDMANHHFVKLKAILCPFWHSIQRPDFFFVRRNDLYRTSCSAPGVLCFA